MLGIATTSDLKKLREDILASFKTINTKLDKIMKTQAELQAAVEAATAEIVKIRAEQKALVTDLTTQVNDLKAIIAAGGPITPALEAAADQLLVTIKDFDDEIPDAAEPPPAQA